MTTTDPYVDVALARALARKAEARPICRCSVCGRVAALADLPCSDCSPDDVCPICRGDCAGADVRPLACPLLAEAADACEPRACATVAPHPVNRRL